MGNSNRAASEPRQTDVVESLNRSSDVKVVSQFGWVSGGKTIAALLQAVTLVLLARWAGPIGFGTASLVLGIIPAIQTAFELGLPTYIVRERAKDSRSSRVLRALQINNTTSRCLVPILALLMVSFAYLLNQPDLLALLPLALWAAVDRNTETWLGVAIADGNARVSVLVLLGRRLGSLITMTGLFAAGVEPLLAFSIGLTSVGIAANFFTHRWVHRRLNVRVLPEPALPILRASVPYWIDSSATQLRNVDILVVGGLSSGIETAFYAAASRVTGPLKILPTSLAAVLVPAATRVGKTSKLRQLAIPVAVVMGSTAFLYIAIIVAAPVAVPWALGAAYQGAVLPIQIVCAGLIFAAVVSVCTSILQGLGCAASAARVSIIVTVLFLVGVVAGTAWAGAVGAALALAASFVAQAILLLGILWHFLRAKSPV